MPSALPITPSKVCPKCKCDKPRDQYYNSNRRKDGLSCYCKVCIKATSDEWRAQNLDKWRDYSRKNRNAEVSRQKNKEYREANKEIVTRKARIYYWKQNGIDMTIEKYEELLVAQDYSCLICKKHMSESKYALNVDHNHNTGEIRGLLCSRCNRGLGYFCDDPELLVAAAEYLTEKGNY